MTPEEIIIASAEDGVRITLSGADELKAGGNQVAINAWLPILREHKFALIDELHRQRRRAKVLALLRPGQKYAIYVEDETRSPVQVAVAIAGLASFELEIPKQYYNGVALLELIEKHASDTRSEPPQQSGNTITAPDSYGRNQAPRRAA